MQYWIALSTYNNIGREHWLTKRKLWSGWWKPTPRGKANWDEVRNAISSEDWEWLRRA
jgi:hypothetical protein